MNLFTRWRSSRYLAIEGQYREQIKGLTPSSPMKLPAIRPLKAVRAARQTRRGRVANFSRGRL